MMMKTKILEKGYMEYTGHKVLKSIMDNSTPAIDLFVREVIQNSADAVLKNKDYARIEFNIGNFDNNSLCNCIPDFKTKLKELNPNNLYKFISISDSNTSGLLGKSIKNEDGGPNNLFNLVYDFMNDKDDDLAGGSYGVGKSVYYRYGNGLCFYYSRTFENGTYQNKLAGCLIQDEKKANCILGKKSRGLAYLGNIENDIPMPIYDDEQISEFLNIFDLSLYTGDKTGTIVIIPYLDEKLMLDNYNNSDDDVQKYWLEDLESCLKMSIQRWYFPKINNENYKGKYLRIAVNHSHVELCDFFEKMQQLYMGTLKDIKKEDITGKGFDDNSLGTMFYKVFTKDELNVLLPPDNNPSPKYFVDSIEDCDKTGLLFYTRKPGMILNYFNKDFGTYDIEDGKYLIGIFVLNDDLTIKNENLGKYMRKTEKANHDSWNNDKFEEFPVLSKKRPYAKICAYIKNKLSAEFKQTQAINLDGSSNILQRKLGMKLLPPLDFGTNPSITPNIVKKEPLTPKKNKIVIDFNGLNSKGNLVYNIEFILKSDEKFKMLLQIKAGTKKLNFKEWEDMGFELPCNIERIDVVEFWIDQAKRAIPSSIDLHNDFIKRKKKIINGIEVYKVRGIATNSCIPSGVIIYNSTGKQLKMKLAMQVKPFDNRYAIGVTTSIEKENSHE